MKKILSLILILAINLQLFLFVEPVYAAPPATPTLNASYLHDNVQISDTTPELRFSTTDPESNDLTYQIAWDTDSGFPSPTTKTSNTDPGFANVDDGGDTDPFTSGDTISYTFQSALSNNTTYFYHVRAKDPGGDNTYSSWSSIRSFTIDTSAAETSWFQTHADQFSTDTLSGTTADESGHYLKITGWYNFSWLYRKPITITYSGSTLSNHDVVIELDTASLISAKMQSDCDDIRVTDSDKTTDINYWVEGGCNTTTTQLWATVPSIPDGGKTIYVYYGNSSATNNEQSWSGNFILGFTAPTCPIDWTRDSTFDQRFPYGAESYGTTGGNSTHSHTSYSGSTGDNVGATVSTQRLQGDPSGNFAADSPHSHSSVTIPVNTSSNDLPPYFDLVYCKGNDLTIPQNFIAMFDTAPASGWTAFSELNQKFPRGSETYGGTGGASSHSHTTSAATTNKYSYTDYRSDMGTPAALAYYSHNHVFNASTTPSVSNEPPYLDMLFYKADAQTVGTDNMIVMADAVPPLGWTTYPELINKIPRGNSTYGGIGGSADHSHTVTLQSLETTSGTAQKNGSGSNWATAGHTHNVSWDTNSVSNLPPYATSYFIERKTPSASTSAGSEESASGTATSTSITAANINASATNWKKLFFTDNETGSDIKYKVYYDVSGTPTIVPDGDLTGNSSGFDTSPVDLSNLGVGTSFAILYIKAELSASGANPQLQDWEVTLGDNIQPGAPTVNNKYLHDNAQTNDLTPELRFAATDSDEDDLTYQIEWDTDASFPSSTTKTSDTDAGFVNVDDGGDTNPFTSGDTISYTFQSELSDNTTYFYRIKAKDPNGSNSYGSWSSIRSFTVTSSLSNPAWFQTMADQFSTDTLSGTTADESGHYLKIPTPSGWLAGYTYKLSIPITYSGVGVTAHDVIIEIDTQTLISNNKMENDCDDIRVTDSDGTTELNYWIEAGCNTDATQLWTKVPSIPNGGKTIYVYYGNSSAANNEQSWNGNFILGYTAPCPTGWAQDSTFDTNFPYGAASYGSTDGTTTHSHTSYDGTAPKSTSYNITNYGSRGLAISNHTHTVTIPIENNTNVQPPYLDLIYCKDDDLVIPTDFIAMFDTAPASGWTTFPELNQKFPRGSDTYGGTGGSASHSHTTTEAQTSTSSAPHNGTTSTYDTSDDVHHHHFAASAVDNADNIPPYLDMLFYQADSEERGTDNMIVMADAVPPLGWTRFIALDDKFPRGNTTYGGTGGSSSHSHAINLTSGGSSASQSRGSGTAVGVSTYTHTHTLTGNSATNEHIPPYATSYFIERKTPEASTSIGSESSLSGTATSTAITGTDIYFSATKWANLSFNDTGTITYKIYYDVSGTPTIVPDDDLSGNSTGFTSSPVDLSSLTTKDYPILYIKAELASADAQLQDWQVNLGTPLGAPSACVIDESVDDSSLTFKWADNASGEDGYDVDRSVDNANYADLSTEAANTTSKQDSTVSQTNTYSYRVRAYYGTAYTPFCYSQVLSLESGAFKFEGIKMEGIKID